MWQYVSCAIDGSMSADDVELHTLPLYHCAQLDCFLGADVYLGATSIILPAPDPARDPAHDRGASGSPSSSRRRRSGSGCCARRTSTTADLSTLRKGYYGASPMPVEVLEEMQRRLPDVRPVELLRPDRDGAAGHDPRTRRAARARRARPAAPALNVETRIVDDARQPGRRPATVGEIVHRSPHATLGYYNDEAKTAEAFRGGWFHSGDLGYVDEDGRLYVVDRKKDMIKTGGENVASREVEEAIYQLDGVAEVAVFGVDHPRWVEAVAAVVVPKEGAA